METLQNPDRSVSFKAVACRKLATPAIIHDDDRTKRRSLYDRFGFASILAAFPDSLRKKELNRTVLILVAALKESETIEQGLQPILRGSSPEELAPNSVRDEDG